MEAAEFKVVDMLSSAGATAGIIIAGMIFLQFVNAKYAEICGRYRELAMEYRGSHEGVPRHGPLQSEIRLYRRRLQLMNRASSVAAIALMCFLMAVLCGGLTTLMPKITFIKFMCAVSLMLGLALVVVAVAIEFYETILARHELYEETADIHEHIPGL